MGAMHLRALRNGAIAAVLTALVGLSLNALVSSDASSTGARAPSSPSTTPSPACHPEAQPLDRAAIRDVTGGFQDVWFDGPARGWAVGSVGEQDTSTTPVLASWDGASWAPSTDASAFGNAALLGVDGTSGSDVWAVGWSTEGFGRDGLAAHFDGTGWNATTALPDGELTDVLPLADDDVWAVGSSGDPTVTEERATAVHWDGSTWTEVPVQAGGGRSGLAAIAGTTGDLWAAGYHHNGGLLLHYDGTSWEPIELPKRTGPMDDVAVAGQTVWAVGDGILRGTGSSMRTVIGAPRNGSFASVVPLATDRAIAVGAVVTGERSSSIAIGVQASAGGSNAQIVSMKAAGSDALTAVTTVRRDTLAAGWREGPKTTVPLVATLRACV
jgi:hypothetical protein